MTTPGALRERTTTWSDPVAALADAAGLTGLEALAAIAAGLLPAPPVALTLGFDIGDVAPGRATFELVPAEYHYNPIGSVHGGVIATLLDTVMGCAVQTTLPAGWAYGTTDLQVRYLRGVTVHIGRVRAEGSVVHRRLAPGHRGGTAGGDGHRQAPGHGDHGVPAGRGPATVVGMTAPCPTPGA